MWDMEYSNSNKLKIPIHNPYISELSFFYDSGKTCITALSPITC